MTTARFNGIHEHEYLVSEDERFTLREELKKSKQLVIYENGNYRLEMGIRVERASVKARSCVGQRGSLILYDGVGSGVPDGVHIVIVGCGGHIHTYTGKGVGVAIKKVAG